jgi:hypothetical protein
MPKSVGDIFGLLKSAGEYVLNSDYDIKFGGPDGSPLNAYQDYVEALSIPSRTLSTSDSRTANSASAKIASDITFEDLEVTWRVKPDFKIYKDVEKWMNKAKKVSSQGVITTGYFDDYCKKNNCRIYAGNVLSGGSSGLGALFPIVTIIGIYPTTMQTIPFSTEGGEYIKFTATFHCYVIPSLAS